MAQQANTFSKYGQIGARESLQDIINDVSVTETPLYSMIKKSNMESRNTLHEWQTDTLVAANANNAAIEADTFAATAITPTQRIGNFTQIFTKNFIISRTAMRMNTAGRANELKYQIAKQGREIKRDIEAACLSNNAAVAGNNTTARKLAGMETWIATNSSNGVGGSTPIISGGQPTTAPTDGTPRAFAETLLKAAIAIGVPNGAMMKTLFLGVGNKQSFSAFPGIAQTRYDVRNKDMSAIIGAADVYVSDFGNLAVIPNIFQRNRTALGIDPEYVEMKHYDPLQAVQYGRIADGENWQLIYEGTLVCKNEKAHFKVADLT